LLANFTPEDARPEINCLPKTQLESERAKRIEERSAIEKELKDFEDENRSVVTRGGKTSTNFTDLRKIYDEQIATITKQRDEQREHSKKTDQEYRIAQKKLEQQYLNVREKFVPNFNALAKLFLGVDLDIGLENRENVTLVLEVRKTKRRADYQLSESQRFFIDIALRMAFAQFASPSGMGAPLYIDTPPRPSRPQIHGRPVLGHHLHDDARSLATPRRRSLRRPDRAD
jgi:hypothetical protein